MVGPDLARSAAVRGPVVTAAVHARGLTRVFGELRAVESVDLSIEPGTIYGFLGRNGAGKTTVIRMLLGLIGPTSGEAALLGHPVDSRGGRSGPWKRVGYLVDGPGLYPELTTAEHLDLATAYRRLPSRAAPTITERLALGPYLHVRAGQLSMGNRQRLGLALALIHDPELLVLDEPTNGMDPAGVVEIRALLLELAGRGTTVFMSTHIVTELAKIADRVGIIDSGRLIQTLDQRGLQDLGQPRLTLTMGSHGLATRAATALAAHGYPVSGQGMTVTCADRRAWTCPETIVTILVHAQAPPRSMAVEQDTLEEHFLLITRGQP